MKFEEIHLSQSFLINVLHIHTCENAYYAQEINILAKLHLNPHVII